VRERITVRLLTKGGNGDGGVQSRRANRSILGGDRS